LPSRRDTASPIEGGDGIVEYLIGARVTGAVEERLAHCGDASLETEGGPV
jgi:hypothetical protein